MCKKTLFEFLEDLDRGAYVVDRERKIIFWNKRAEEITGYSPEEVIGKSCKDNILSHTDRYGALICPTELCPLFRTIKTGKSSHIPFAVYAKKKNGERIPLSITTFPLFENGKVIGGVEIFDEATMEERDISIAIKVQESLLPKDVPGNIKIFYRPFNAIGGDMVFCRMPWVGLVDVSGHGISSALVSSTVKIILDETLNEKFDITILPLVLEKRFSMFKDVGVYLTGIFVKKRKKNCEIVSLGHPPPIIIRNGEAEVIKMKTCFPIGFGLSHSYHVKPITMNKGDTLFLYSDGVINIRTEEGELGIEGLKEILRETVDPREIYERVMRKNVDILQPDDITMVAIHFN